MVERQLAIFLVCGLEPFEHGVRGFHGNDMRCIDVKFQFQLEACTKACAARQRHSV